LGGIGCVVTWQFTALANELPQHAENLKHKLADLRGMGHGGVIEKVQQTIEEVLSERHQAPPPRSGGLSGTEPERPVPVVVQGPSVLWSLPTLLEPLASAGLVVVLVIFMLLKHSDLRNRLIRLEGYRQLTTATKALDEAGQRISRYLLMQSIINGSFGVGVGLGVFLIGVPYALLWGFLAATLRFIPYVGPGLATILPSAPSLAVFPGWWQPVLVIGLIAALELTNFMVLEPWLYGQSAGVSEVALLVAVAFWTWLWGPVGLLLATPLTVCLSVLSRYIPQLDFINTLMGDEPALELPTIYYQRLLAKDADEAAEVVETYEQTHAPEDVYDDIVVPAALAAALIIGLLGVALGAHELVPPRRVVRVRDFGFGAALFSVVGTLLAFGARGWVASKIAGLRRAEPAMLHGAMVWLLAVPLLLVLAALGAGGSFGGWYRWAGRDTPMGHPAERPRRPRCRAGSAQQRLRRDHCALTRADRQRHRRVAGLAEAHGVL
jgi:predicted PurR-regulated permease PerM